MSVADLLPGNRVLHEECLAIATNPAAPVLPLIEEARGFRYARPLNKTVAPWLVLEYGLGRLAEYFETVEDLIDEGRAWQRIRGTPAAVEAALGWIGYDDVLIEDHVRQRRRWHLYQIAMGALPSAATETKLLLDAERLAGLSDRARSELFRGHHGYDVRETVLGSTRWGDGLWGDVSGVRIGGGSVKWSHGRTHSISGTVDPDVYALLGVDYEDGDVIGWEDEITWQVPGVTWEGISDASAVKAWRILREPAHIALSDDDGLIGHARVFDARDITGEDGYDDGPRYLRFSAIVPFAASPGKTVSEAAVVLGGAAKFGVKPAKQWYAPGELLFADGVTELFSKPLSIDLMKTCRERITVVAEI